MKYIKYLLIILILSFINVNADTVYKKGTIAKNTTDVYVRSCASGTCDRILNDTGGKISISYPEAFEIIGEEGNFYKIKLFEMGTTELEGIINKLLISGQSKANISLVLNVLPMIRLTDLNEVLESFGPDAAKADITDILIKAKHINDIGGSL